MVHLGVAELLLRSSTEMTEPQFSWLHTLPAHQKPLGSLLNPPHSMTCLISNVPLQPLFPPTNLTLLGSDEKKRKEKEHFSDALFK